LSLGGEQSGHIIFRDHEQTGDGALTGAMLLDVVQGTGHSLSLLVGVMQRFPQVLRNVAVRDRAALDGAGQFWEEAAAVETDLGADGRVLVRPSGTEAVVRVMVEAPSLEQAELIADRLVGSVQRACGAPASPA
jgi:phosphoglucosamine mutase